MLIFETILRSKQTPASLTLSVESIRNLSPRESGQGRLTSPEPTGDRSEQQSASIDRPGMRFGLGGGGLWIVQLGAGG